MDRADDAKARLLALHQPVPETDQSCGRAKQGRRRQPPGGEHLLEGDAEPGETSERGPGNESRRAYPGGSDPGERKSVMQQATRAALGPGSDSHSVSVETVGGVPGPGQPAPRSDTPTPADAATPPADSSASAGTASPPATAQPDPNELKPNAAAADPNELKPNVSEDNGPALPPPQQVNEIQPGTARQTANGTSGAASTSGNSASSSTDANEADDATVASSKH